MITHLASPPESMASAAAAQPLGVEALTKRILEQFDHGILLLRQDGRLLHANRVARRECVRHGSLHLVDGRLQAVRAGDHERLTRALGAAARGLRTLLNFDNETDSLPLVVVPLSTPHDGGPWGGLVLAMMAKRSGSEMLNIELFANAIGLTSAERAVLKGLCSGLDPAGLAKAHGVALSTVRTQVMQIRQKTQTPSIRGLLNLVNNLPPVVCATDHLA